MRDLTARLAALLAVALLVLLAGPAAVATAAAQRLFTLTDARLDEVSGLAVGVRSPGVLYVQNDSGDSARFFALDARTGRVRAEYRVPGAHNVDWEDLATGPDSSGVASVWLADIGDNDEVRREIDIYRVDEPKVGADGVVQTGTPEVWRLRYPDGAHNAESLLLDPVSHRLFVATKSLFGQTQVYAAPVNPDPSRVQALVRIGSVGFGLTGTAGGPNVVGQLTATAGSMSADGTQLVLRTYTDAYLWNVRGNDVAAALRTAPTRVALPAQPQGEGIAISGGALLTDSEQVGSAVYRVPLPAADRSPAAPTATISRPAGTASPSVTKPVVQAVSPAGNGGPPVWPVVGGAVLVLAAGGVLLAARRRRPG